MTPRRDRIAAAALAAGIAWGAEHALRRTLSAHPRWRRRNFRDRDVVLSAGPAVAVGALSAVAASYGGADQLAGALVAGGTAAVLGCYDDLYGDSHARGLRGHLAALRQGRLTTGMTKLVGLVGGGLLAAACSHRRAGAAVVDTVLVAGTANLVNLLDLRPGRALKAALLVAAVTTTGSQSPSAVTGAAVAGAAAATLPADLGERVMIGDCGANALGALLGWSLARGLGPTGRAVAVAAVTALTLASERVSFTDVIARTRWLRAVDEWGRRT